MKKIILFSFLFIFIGCNNWSENPEIKKQSGNTTNPPFIIPIGVINEIAFPSDLTCMIQIKYYNSNITLSGTKSGAIFNSNGYPSNDAIPVFTVPNGTAINCLYAYTDNPIAPTKVVFFAGTDKGIYKSTDLGKNWQSSIIKSSKTGEFISALAFDYSTGASNGKYFINAYGWDGKNNKFSTTDDGITWDCSSIQKGRITSRITYKVLKPVSGGQMYVDAYFTASKDESGSYITGDSATAPFVLPNGIRVNSLFGDEGVTCYASTSNGVYKTSGNGRTSNSWQKSGLDNKIITSIVAHSNGSVYAGTTNGCFRSSNFGDYWYELGYTAKNSPVYMFMPSSGNLVMQDNERGFFAGINLTGDIYIFKPILISPVDNSVGDSIIPVFRWTQQRSISGLSQILQISTDPSFPKDNSITCRLPGLISDSIYYYRGILNNKTKYYWKMKSYMLFGSTSWSDVNCFTTK